MTRITQERWERIEPILDHALNLEPSARAEYLDSACTADATLRADIDALLLADRDAAAFLATPIGRLGGRSLEGLVASSGSDASEATIDFPVDVSVAERVGPYRLLREIGRGGMGSVFLAERADGQWDQRVAIKLIRRGMDSADILRRFLRERQILARLEHPNIARLLDGGASEGGQPFLAMEFVDGRPIIRYCDDERLPIDERILLFATVCDAVQYAHRNLVVHRDLKPSNVLVTPEGKAKLLDFGIATVLDPPADEDTTVGDSGDGHTRTGLTRTGRRVMTPEYASPEQIRGDPVTTVSDVYALGMILYELLTGHAAYRLDRGSPAELERIVSELEPMRPSVAVARTEVIAHRDGTSRDIVPGAVAQARSTAPDRLRHKLSGDLDNIVLRALAKEPGRRYASAEALADDLRRHLGGLPVLARSNTPAYRARKFVRRHHIAVAAALLVFLSLVAGLAGTAWQARAAARESRKAVEVQNFLVNLFQVSDPNVARGEEVTARELLDRGAKRVASDLAAEPEVQAEMNGVLGRIFSNLGLHARAAPLLASAVQSQRAQDKNGSAELALNLRSLATALHEQGKDDEAEPLLRESLAMRRALYGQHDPRVAESLYDLASLLHAKGAYAAAESTFESWLVLRRSLPPRRDAESANGLTNYGLLLDVKGAYAQAEEVLRSSLTMRRQLYGNNHLDVAESLFNLGYTLDHEGKYAESETAIRESLDIRRRLLGDESVPVADALDMLASTLAHEGAYDSSETIYRSSIAQRGRLIGVSHPTISFVRLQLADVLRTHGKYAEAEAMLRAAVADQRGRYGPDHLFTLPALEKLASALRDDGKFDEAEPLYRAAIDRYKRTYGRIDRHGTTAQLGLGRLLVMKGDAKGAEAVLASALQIEQRETRRSPAKIALAEGELGACLRVLGRYPEAERLLLSSQHASAHAPWRQREEAMQRLASLYESWQRPAAAAAYRDSLDIARKRLSARFPDSTP